MIDTKNDHSHIKVFQRSIKTNKPYGNQYFCDYICMMDYYASLHNISTKNIRNLWATYLGKTKKLGPLMDDFLN